MKPNSFFSIGLMSGTSLDGMDAVLLQHSADLTHITFVNSSSQKFSVALQNILQKNCHPQTSSVAEISDLHFYLAELAAKLVKKLLYKTKKRAEQIQVIGFHGQTLHHLPTPHRFLNHTQQRSTFQIGDGPYLSALTGIPVVNNFRTKDFASGGCGAPLVPFAHHVLFSPQNKKMAVHNLGGISNVSYFNKTKKIAFDTGPCNMLLDGLTKKLFSLPFDKFGRMAQKGERHTAVVEHFLQHPFFKKKPPKSTGREDFGDTFVQNWLKLMKQKKMTPHNLLATATEFVASTIFLSYQKNILSHGLDEIIFCGGGANNHFLLKRLEFYFLKHQVKISTSQAFGFAVQDVEAASFAVLAFLALHQKINQYAELTGSKISRSLGQISYPT